MGDWRPFMACYVCLPYDIMNGYRCSDMSVRLIVPKRRLCHWSGISDIRPRSLAVVCETRSVLRLDRTQFLVDSPLIRWRIRRGESLYHLSVPRLRPP